MAPRSPTSGAVASKSKWRGLAIDIEVNLIKMKSIVETRRIMVIIICTKKKEDFAF